MDIFSKAHPWVLFSLILMAVVIGLLLCTPARKDTIGQAKYDALEQKVKDTARYYEELLKADSAAINSAEQATADSREQAEVYRREAAAQQGTIDRLVAKIRGAKTETPDDSFVKVSPNYVEGCDSLAEQNTALKQSNQQYEDQNAETMKLMSYEVSIRDSVLSNEREFNAKFRAQLDNCMLQLKGKVDAKQRVQIYAGMGVLGNQINPIGGAQVNLGLRARNSQMYEVTGMMVGNTWYAGVGTKFLLSLRKK